MHIKQVVQRARRLGKIKNGVVLCDNCDTPASKSGTRALSWVGCAPCIYGEAAAFDPKDLIHVQATKRKVCFLSSPRLAVSIPGLMRTGSAGAAARIGGACK